MGQQNIVWLSTREAADQLGITVRTLYKLIDEGELPAYRIGRVIRLQQEEVDAYIPQARIVPGTLAHLHTPGVEHPEEDEPPG